MTDVSDFIDVSDPAALEDAVARAREVLADRGCVVLPTDTVYGIGADAFSPLAVAVLLAAKGRGRTMPPPVLIADRRVMAGLAYDVPEEAEALAERFWPGALTLILKSQPTLTWDLGETRGTVALRMPDDEVALELLRLEARVAAVDLRGFGASDKPPIGYDPATHGPDLERVRRVMPLARDLRRAGAASLDLAYVAAGRLDGYFERGLHPWDHAAGGLLVTEAGGLIGGAPDGAPGRQMTIAAGPDLFSRLREVIAI